ncbi:MAG: hypothetical protein AAF389_13220 [Gemmatimonadota bacterium]
MQEERLATGIPAAERAIAGLCHDINNRLASLHAYLFVLERRGLSAEETAVVAESFEGVAAGVRLIRSLSRGGVVEVGPVGLGVVAKHATDIMRHYPDGVINFTVADSSHEAGDVIRGDWTQILRAVLLGSAWLRRGVDPETPVSIILSGGGPQEILLEALGDLADAPFEELVALPGDGVEFSSAGDRSVRIAFFQPDRA